MILSIALSLAQAAAQPITIPIQNPSFESPVSMQYQKDCGAFTYETPPGWTSSTGTVAVVVPASPRTCDFSNPPDGKQFALIANGSLSQDLGDVYTILPHDAHGEVNGVYAGHFLVGDYFYWYPGQFSASLTLKCGPANKFCAQGTTKVLCPVAGWGMGDFTDVTFTCPSQRQYGELILTLGSTGYQMLFDNVSLTFTPTN